MAIRFDDIGNRLKAFRLGSGLSAEDLAAKLGISRTALYRFEKGELAKIETLEKLAELLSVSVPTLLGVGVEYVASAVSYFERMRQIEESCEHIIVLAGPISYLLASDPFDQALGDILRESISDTLPGRKPGAEAKRLEPVSDVVKSNGHDARHRFNQSSGGGVRNNCPSCSCASGAARYLNSTPSAMTDASPETWSTCILSRG